MRGRAPRISGEKAVGNDGVMQKDRQSQQAAQAVHRGNAIGGIFAQNGTGHGGENLQRTGSGEDEREDQSDPQDDVHAARYPSFLRNSPMRSIPLSICSMLVAKLRRTCVSNPLSLPGTTATWLCSSSAAAKRDRIGDRCPADGFAEIGADVGEAIKRPLRPDAGDFGQGGQPLPHVLAALFELLAHLLDALGAAGRSGPAAAGICVKLVMWLVIWLCNLLMASIAGFGPADVADAPAGHGETLAVAVERQRALQQIGMQRGEADEFQAVVNQLLVNLIAEDDHLRMLRHDVGQRFQFLPAYRRGRRGCWGC